VSGTLYISNVTFNGEFVASGTDGKWGFRGHLIDSSSVWGDYYVVTFSFNTPGDRQRYYSAGNLNAGGGGAKFDVGGVNYWIIDHWREAFNARCEFKLEVNNSPFTGGPQSTGTESDGALWDEPFP
jgi:hypothetical protein